MCDARPGNGQRACQQSHTRRRRGRGHAEKRELSTAGHILCCICRALSAHTRLCLRAFGSLFVVDFFFLMHMIDRPLPAPNSDSVCIECGRILRISYLRATADSSLSYLPLSLSFSWSISPSTPRCLICSVNPAPYW